MNQLRLITLFIATLGLLISHGRSGLDMTWQYTFREYRSGGDIGILSLSYLVPNRFVSGFSDFSMVGKFSSGERRPDASHKRMTSMFGFTAGHLFLVGQPWLRPGFNVGTVWKTMKRVDDEENKLGMYYAFKLQLLFLTFQVSNYGLGGGVNLTL